MADPKEQFLSQGAGSETQELSKGLMQGAFDTLGSAFAEELGTPQLQQTFSQTGANIANAMQMRWWKKEAEDFQTIHANAYQSQSRDLMVKLKDQMQALNLGQIIGPDGTITKVDPAGPEATQLRDNILYDTTMSLSALDDELISNATKYKSNPFVNTAIESFVKSRVQMISQLTGPTEADERTKQYAETDLARAQAEYYRAGAKQRLTSDEDGSEKQLDYRKMTPDEMVGNYGIDGYYNILTTTELGSNMIGSDLIAASGEVTQSLMQKHGIENELDPRLKPLAAAKDAEVRDIAAKRAIARTLGPDAVKILEITKPHLRAAELPGEQPTPPKFPEPITSKEQSQAIESEKSYFVQQLTEVIKKEDPPSLEAALDRVDDLIKGRAGYHILGKNSLQSKFRKRYVEEISDYVRQNWNESELAAERYADSKAPRKRGLLEKLGSIMVQGSPDIEYLKKYQKETEGSIPGKSARPPEKNPKKRGLIEE